MRKTKIYYLHRGDGNPFYIGKTNLNIKTKRIYSHKYNFGKNIFEEEIDIVPTSEWKFWEKHYISLYKSWGFKLENKNDGGGGLTFVKKETKLKISNKIKNNKIRGAKISKATKGISKSHKGKKFSKKHKEKIKATRGFLKNRKNTWSKKCLKPINQYDLQGNLIKEFNSLKEANLFLGLKERNSQIGRCANGHIKTSYGFKWKYKNK